MTRKISPQKLIESLDLPHLRDGGCWRSIRPALDGIGAVFDCHQRLSKLVQQLRKRRVADSFIARLIHDLYWDAVTEKALDNLAREKEQARKFLIDPQDLRMGTAEVEDTFGIVRATFNPEAEQHCRTCNNPPPPVDGPPCEQCGGLPQVPGPEAARSNEPDKES